MGGAAFLCLLLNTAVNLFLFYFLHINSRSFKSYSYYHPHHLMIALSHLKSYIGMLQRPFDGLLGTNIPSVFRIFHLIMEKATIYLFPYNILLFRRK